MVKVSSLFHLTSVEDCQKFKCKNCLAYRTPFCPRYRANDNVDLIRPNDGVCMDYYPLKERIKSQRIYTRIEDRELEQYVIE